MPGLKRGPDGHVSLARIAGTLGVNRRVLKRLHEAGELAGVRAGGVIWLERRPLAEYLWARPRCVRDDCGRRVIGAGPGCDRHRRDGRRRATRRSRPAEPLAWDRCEWCGEPSRGRFCKPACSVAWLNEGKGAGARRAQLQEGHRRYRVDVKRAKADRGLLNVDELLGRLRRAGVPRSPAAISGHIRDGLVEPERGLGFDKPHLFTVAAVDGYINRLRGYGDGRLSRFNAATPEQAKTRATLYLARHNSYAEFGRVATAINRAGPKPKLAPDEEAEIRRRRAGGETQEQIADAVGVTRKQVRRVLAGGD